LGQRLLAWLRALRQSIATGLGKLRVPGAPVRVVVIVLAAIVLIAGAAYGLSKALGSGSSPVASASHNLPYLGAQMESVPINRVLVSAVVPNSPAAQAGIGPGDIIVTVNNQAISQPGDVTALLRHLHPGDSVSIQIERGGIPYTTRATLTSQRSP
jgi:S1-C subfamily serine protease